MIARRVKVFAIESETVPQALQNSSATATSSPKIGGTLAVVNFKVARRATRREVGACMLSDSGTSKDLEKGDDLTRQDRRDYWSLCLILNF